MGDYEFFMMNFTYDQLCEMIKNVDENENPEKYNALVEAISMKYELIHG